MCEEIDYSTLPKFIDVFPAETALVNAVDALQGVSVDIQPDFVTFVWFVLSHEFDGTPLVYQTIETASKRLAYVTYTRLASLQKKYLYWVETLAPDAQNKLDFLRLYLSSNTITNGGTVTTDGTSKVARNPTDVVNSTDFVDDYANENWKSHNVTTPANTQDKEYEKTGNLENLFEVFKSIPSSLADDIATLYTPYFLPLLDVVAEA